MALIILLRENPPVAYFLMKFWRVTARKPHRCVEHSPNLHSCCCEKYSDHNPGVRHSQSLFNPDAFMPSETVSRGYPLTISSFSCQLEIKPWIHWTKLSCANPEQTLSYAQIPCWCFINHKWVLTCSKLVGSFNLHQLIIETIPHRHAHRTIWCDKFSIGVLF